ncbi:MAG: DUF1501 domain-containing protein [Candidatus Kapabacteria bacterium]|jgi:uncharacterized protein (DUF1501 family)|nr:DUF1501 domain-containing protein [Candidatus Kapabacteria bacterium]
MKRRSFLRTIGATGATVATLPGLIDGFTVQALAGDTALESVLAANDRILVLIQLQGGNDGLNTLVPIENSRYYAARPTLGLRRQDTLDLNDTLRWHKALAGMKALYDEGNVAIVQGVTYPNPDRSHFRGTDIWLTATDADVFGTTGWMGRYLATLAPGYPREIPAEPLAVQIGSSVSLGLQSADGPMGISFRDPEEFARLVQTGATEEVPSSLQDDTPAGREVAFMRTIARSANVYANVVKQAADRGTSSSQYPTTDIGARLRIVGRLISGGLGARVYLVSWANNNFDTHANQVVAGDPSTGSHANLLRELGDAVKAFMDDMKAQGKHEKIAGMTFSEFGRRVAENGSTGTDHGTSAPLFVFGSDVRGGVYGKDPNLEELDDRGDMLMDYDYRDVYASILLQWFGIGGEVARDVLFRDFSATALPLFRTPVSVRSEDAGGLPTPSIWPNPATHTVTMRVGGIHPFTHAWCEIADMQGRTLITTEVPQSGELQLDVSRLPNGAYICTVGADRSRVRTFLHVSR